MKNALIFIIGGIFGSIITIFLAISGAVKLVSSNDVSVSYELSREDVARMDGEASAPSAEGIHLSTKGKERALFRCPADSNELCKVEFNFAKKY